MSVHYNMDSERRYIHPSLYKSLSSKWVLLLGANDKMLNFYRELSASRFLGAQIIGYLDDGDFELTGLNKIGSLKDLSQFLRNNIVDVLLIGLPIRSAYDQINAVVSTAELHGTPVIFPFGFFEAAGRPYVFSDRKGGFAGLENAALPPVKSFVKQTIDRIFPIS